MGIGNPQILGQLYERQKAAVQQEKKLIQSGAIPDPVKTVQEKYGNAPLTATGRDALKYANSTSPTGILTRAEIAQNLEYAYQEQARQQAADKFQAEHRAKTGGIGATSEAVKQQEQRAKSQIEGKPLGTITDSSSITGGATVGTTYKRTISDSVGVSEGVTTKGGAKTIKVNISDSVGVTEGGKTRETKTIDNFKEPRPEQIKAKEFFAEVGQDNVLVKFKLKELGQQPELEQSKILPWLNKPKEVTTKPYVFGEAALNVLKSYGSSFGSLFSIQSDPRSLGLLYDKERGVLFPIDKITSEYEERTEKINKLLGTGEVTTSAVVNQLLSGQPITGSGRGLAYDIESVATEAGLIFLPVKGIPLPLRAVKFGESSVLVFGTSRKVLELATISKGKITRGVDIQKIGEGLKKEIPVLKEKANRPTEFEFLGQTREAIVVKEKNLSRLVEAGYLQPIEETAIKGGKTIMKDVQKLPDVVRREKFPEQITESIPKGEPTIKTIEFLRKSKSDLHGSMIDVFTNIRKYQYLPSDIDFVINKPKEGLKLGSMFRSTTGKAFESENIVLKQSGTGKGTTRIKSFKIQKFKKIPIYPKIKLKPNEVIHGTSKRSQRDILSGGIDISASKRGEAFFTTSSVNLAKHYAKRAVMSQGSKQAIVKLKLEPSLVLKWKKIPKKLKSQLAYYEEIKQSALFQPKIINYAKSLGYSAVEKPYNITKKNPKTEVIIFNENVVSDVNIIPLGEKSIPVAGQKLGKVIEFVYKGETGEGLSSMSKTGRVFGYKLPTGSFEREGVKIKSGRFQTGRMTASVLSLEVKEGQIKLIPSRVKDYPKQFARVMSEAQTARETGEFEKAIRIEKAALDIRKLGEKTINYEDYFKSRKMVGLEEMKQSLTFQREQSKIESISKEFKESALSLGESAGVGLSAKAKFEQPSELKQFEKMDKSIESNFKKFFETESPSTKPKLEKSSPPSEIRTPSSISKPSISKLSKQSLSKPSFSNISKPSTSRPSTVGKPSKPSLSSPSRSNQITSPSSKPPSKPPIPSRPPSVPSGPPSRPPSVPSGPPSRPPSVPSSPPSRPPSRTPLSRFVRSSSPKPSYDIPRTPKRGAIPFTIKSTTKPQRPYEIPPRKEFIGNVPLTKVEGYYFKRPDISYKKPALKAERDIKKATKEIRLNFGKGLKSNKVKVKF